MKIKKLSLIIGIIAVTIIHIYQSKMILYFYGYCADDKNYSIFCNDLIVKNAMLNFGISLISILVIFISLLFLFKNMKKNN